VNDVTLGRLAEIRLEVTQNALESMRKRLLDLSNRNKLLNYRHRESARQLRLINSSLESVLTGFSARSEMRIRGLPDPDGAEADAELSAALEKARLLDADYQRALQTDDDALIKRLDEQIVAEVRLQLGMSKKAPPPAEVAQARGMNIDYDLAVSAEPDEPGAILQTLLFEEALSRKLSSIRDEAITTLQELGINTLYVALGFLEWFESDSSTKALQSPLVICPVELIRRTERGRYSYRLKGVEEELETNVTLEERLRSDFEISLPTFDPERQTLQSYFDTVEVAIKGKQRWKIRSFATIGLFNFTRLSMYQDLDSSRRPADEALDQHELILDLLGGVADDTKNSSSPIEEIVSPYHQTAPMIIADADASQYSAILEALAGKNLIIEGPPGTGKSQTITNIIAAALHDGKTVLFVAEKLAALQVVKARLDQAQLGDFCLELHSTKTRKTDFYAGIRARLGVSRSSKSPNVADTRFEANKQTNAIESYCEALHEVKPAFSATLFDLIWREQELRSRIGDVGNLQALSLPNLERLDQFELRELKTKLSDFTDRLKFFTQQYGSLSGHPLALIQIESASRETAISLKNGLEALLRHFGKLRAAFENNDLSATESEWTWASIASIIDCIRDLSSLAPEPEASAVAICRELTGSGDTSPESLIKECGTLASSLNALQESGLPRVLIEDPRLERLARLLSDSDLPESATYTELTSLASRHDSYARNSANGIALLLEASAELTWAPNPSPIVANALISAATVCHGIDDEVGQLLTHDVIANASMLRKAIQVVEDLRRRLELDTLDFKLPSNVSPDVMRTHARSLREKKWTSFMSPSYREAVRYYKQVANRRPSDVGPDQADQLERLATDLEAQREFEKDPILLRLLPGFNGVETDFKPIALALDAWEKLRAIFAATGMVSKQLEDGFALAGYTAVRILKAASHDSRFTFLSDFASTITDTQDISKESERLHDIARRIGEIVQAWEELSIPPSATVAGLRVAFLERGRRDKATDWLRTQAIAQQLLGADFTPAGLAQAISALTFTSRVRGISSSPIVQEHLLNLEPANLTGANGAAIVASWEAIATEIAALQASVGFDFITASLGTIDSHTLKAMNTVVERILASLDLLPDWMQFQRLRSEVDSRGLQSFSALCMRDPSLDVSDALEYAVLRAVVEESISSDLILSSASGVALNEARGRFRELDRRYSREHRELVRQRLAGRPIPTGNGIGKKGTYTENALLKLEASKSTRHISIRELMKRSSNALQAAKPCFMMSPLSVAQYIQAGTAHFDIVVIDEASQMRPEDALGAISRGSQLIVVGDPKQLPPTTFFDRLESNEDVPDEDSDDAKSILDLAMQQFRLTRRLIWHYRSRHDSLIAFSNQHFYDNELIVFPSADHGERLGVKLRKIAGKYGASLNPIEAQAIAARTLEIMQTEPDMSIAVVAMNQPQRDLIRMEIERLVASNSRAQAYLERWDSEVENFIVKNLESIQGDERDIVLISTVYGPNSDGRVLQNFGPVNNATSGWRRLNVLLTRAKYRLELFTSLSPSDIVIDERTGRGARALHDYIEFANSGRLVQGKITGRAPDSEFEISVARALDKHGYECVPQVGVGNYFIDIGIIDPADHSRFLIGIECDGSAYHSTKSARDRDRLRQEVLERLGWDLHRVWSTDWFSDPNRESNRLLDAIRSATKGKAPATKSTDRSMSSNPPSSSQPSKDVASASERTENPWQKSVEPSPILDDAKAEQFEPRTEGSLYAPDIVEALLRSLPEHGMVSREEVLDSVAALLGMPLTKRLRSIVNKTIMNEVAARRLQVDQSWTHLGRT